MNNFFGNRCGCPPFIPPCPPPRPLCNATVTVGSTTTLEAGQSAYVTNTGTLQNAILNFGIPTGATGPQGEAGTAATVTVGTTTTLPAGSTATVTNSGTSSAAILNFGIPTGATGPRGEAGTAATVTVGTTTTLPAGSTATVTNSGTSSAAILDFGIPTITQGAAVADLVEGATLEEVITTINALFASLRTAGVIATAA